MTGFLGRLASRVVRPAAAPVSPSLQPLTATSPFLPAPDASPGFVEEHVERVARPPASAAARPPVSEPSRAVPAPERPAPSPSRPTTAAESAPPLRRRTAPASDVPPRDGDGQRGPVAEFEPAVTDQVIPGPPDEPTVTVVVARPEGPPTAEPVAIEVQVVKEPAPPVERVIEVREVPGPVVPVVHRVTLPAAKGVEPKSKPAPSFVSTTVPAPRPTVVFVPGEPLGRMGVDPLQPDEILRRPEVAEAVRADSTVHVHIGRLEVARPSSAPPPATPRPKPTLLSLDDYLAERTAAAARGGGR